MGRGSTSQASWRVGIASLVGALSIGAGLAGAAQAAQIGATGGGINCGFEAAAIEPSYVVPAGGGSITSFSTETRSGDAGDTIDFLLLRPAGSTYTVVGHTGLVTLSGTGVETFPASIPAQAGDVLGMWWPFYTDCLRVGPDGDSARLDVLVSDPGPGSTVSFTVPEAGADLNESATLASCTVTVTSAIPGSLTVAAGTGVCVGAGGSIGGAVIVKAGGSLTLIGASIAGSIVSDGAQSITICGTTVGGSVSITNTVGPVQFGDGVNGCTPNRVTGRVLLKNNPPA